MKNLFVFFFSLLFINGLAHAAEPKQVNLAIDGITCPFCVASSSKALKKLDGVKAVNADIKAGLIKVCTEPQTELDNDTLSKLFRDRGFIYRGQQVQEKCDA